MPFNPGDRISVTVMQVACKGFPIYPFDFVQCQILFHNILCIIRELVINAVRHGHATTLKVAGTIDGDRLLFSVADDGCGFDPATRPGMEQGHFGLEGVMERVKALDGTADITSAPGKGPRIAINTPLPEEN